MGDEEYHKIIQYKKWVNKIPILKQRYFYTHWTTVNKFLNHVN